MKDRRRWAYIVVGAFWLLADPHTLLRAQSADQTQLIRQLLARIEQLESRVTELERGADAPRLVEARPAVLRMPMAHAPESSPAPALPAPPSQLPPATAVEIQPSYPSLRWSGFSDMNFSATDQRNARSGFTEGQFALHLSSALSSKVTFFGELSATARADAGTGSPSATGFNFEVERSVIRFDQNDYFKVSFGRYHTPINWWNTAFHHGQWLQTSIARPEMTQFGGRLIPVHFVGGLVEGAVPLGGLNLNYNVGVGNGRGSVISRGGDAGDVNNNRAWLVNLFSKPSRFFGLQVGGSVYRDKLAAAGGRPFDEWIATAHILWQKENPELLAEFANVNHSEVGGAGASFNSQAFYIQAAYRLPGYASLWKPYYRFEYIHIPRTEVVFQGVPNLVGSVVGLRYDISSFAAIKAEYRNQRRAPGQPRVNGGFLQTSFTF
jgi:hypothetical protein